MKKKLEILAIGTMTCGITMVCQPWIHFFFAWGFVVTLAGIGLFTAAAHWSEGEGREPAMINGNKAARMASGEHIGEGKIGR